VIQVAPGTKVYLACRPVSMRYGFDGLAAQVANVLNADPFSGHLFLFRSKRAQRATFYIQFAVCEDCISLAPAVRSHASGISLSARQGSEMYLHGGAAGPLS
jgi:hypothetical protein